MSENVYIRLRGGRAARFLQIKEEMEERQGHGLQHTEVVSRLMMGHDIEGGELTPLLGQ